MLAMMGAFCTSVRLAVYISSLSIVTGLPGKAAAADSLDRHNGLMRISLMGNFALLIASPTRLASSRPSSVNGRCVLQSFRSTSGTRSGRLLSV